ncbi:hypothetical protein KKB99_02455 [bacterium]|nr:hypothetical protein [bacterium]MBU1024848.1 hypothetical protein [bacterium]
MAAKKPKEKKAQAKEPDLFSQAESRSKRKPKEWKYPKSVKYSEVKVGDIFIIKKSRIWDKKGSIEELKGEVLEKGIFDANSRYFLLQMINPEYDGIEVKDIRRFILKKK